MRPIVMALFLLGVGIVGRAETFTYVSLAKDRKIAIYKVDVMTGTLTHLSDTPGEGEPGALVVHPSKTSLFASLRPEGKLVAFRIDPLAGTLTHLNTVEAGPDPAQLSTDKEGRFLLAAYYVAGKVTVHAIQRDGSLRAKSVQTVPTAEKAHAILLDPANRFAFIPHTGPNAIFQFAFDAETGKLTPENPPKLSTPENTGPRHIVFHPKLDIAYIDNEQGSSVTSYRLNRTSGSLEALQTISTLPRDFRQRNACAEIKIHPTGRFLFVSNRGHDSIARFQVNVGSGELATLGHTPTEKTPRSFDLDPAGKFLYVCGEASDRLAAYRIDQETSELTPTATYSVGRTPWWISVVDVSR